MNECDHINEIVKQKVKEITERHEEILTAFIAKYGIEPNKIVQIYQDNTCYLVDIGNTNLCNNSKCYDLRNQLTSEVAKYQEKEKKQDECDHIIEFIGEGEYGNFDIIRQNKFDDGFRGYKCSFCPDCGEKLNEL